jgi:hypothetical protein
MVATLFCCQLGANASQAVRAVHRPHEHDIFLAPTPIEASSSSSGDFAGTSVVLVLIRRLTGDSALHLMLYYW